MRDPRYAIGSEFLDLYKEEIGASEPQEDFDDRNALYSMYVLKMVSPNLGLFVQAQRPPYRRNVAAMGIVDSQVNLPP